MADRQFEYDSGVIGAGTRRPRKFSVVMHNEDYTTMGLVVAVLVTVFHHSQEAAALLMRAVHERGRAVAGIYSYEIAETKAGEAMAMARNEGYPLKCTLKAV